MDWLKGMNRVIEFIEKNLTQTIQYESLSCIVGCSVYEFSRIFSFMTGVSVSEYIRRRRLSQAVFDILNGKEKIIDIALKYCYESPTTFTRAFKELYGLTPMSVRKMKASLKTYPPITFVLTIMEGVSMDKNKTNIGGREIGAISIEMDKDSIHQTNTFFWDTKGNEVLGSTALPSYGAFVSEEKCRLFGDVSGKKMLEIGCGTGHSLQYQGEHKAAELWAVDISEKQIEKAKQHLEACGLAARFICSPMEEECDIPVGYFDFVYSIYAIGWTTDLEGTFCRIASYLKKGGIFIFSWSHPIHKCVATENEMLIFKKCYFDESWYSVALEQSVLKLSDRKLSTYVNALAKAGFVIEQMIEQSDDDIIKLNDENNAFAKKAKMLPVTLVIKAKKL